MQCGVLSGSSDRRNTSALSLFLQPNGFSAEVEGSKVGAQVASAEKGNFEKIKSLLLSAAPIHSDEANWLGLVLAVAV